MASALVRGAVSAAHCSSVAPFSWDETSLRRMECLGTPSPDYGRYIFVFRWVPSDLPESVLNTIYHARAPSTRHLYALKWSSPPGVLPAAQTLFVGKGLLPFHSQGLCSSYSSLTRSYMVNQWAGTTWLFISWRGLGGLIRPALSPSQHGICPQCWELWIALLLSWYSLLTFVPWR